jgi:chromate reductase
MPDVKILAVPGSLRRASFNRALARAAVELAPPGVTIEIAELHAIPLYDGDVEAAGLPAAVSELRARIAAADALLIVTPEYNNSIPGVLKNAIDWVSRGKDQPLKGKPVALAGASNGGFGSVRSQMALRPVLGTLDARTLNRPEVYVSHAQTKIDAEGRLTDEPTREALRKLLVALAEAAEAAAARR